MQGIIFDIKRFSVHDGPGIRQTVFFKGCPLSCWWCHNPEGLSIGIDHIQSKKFLDGKAYIREESVGKKMTVDEVIHEIEKDTVFFDESGGGVTFSGGEPLMQPDFLEALLDECINRNIHTAVDTAGYAPQTIFEKITAKANLILFDLKHHDNDLHTKYTGVSLDLIVNNLQHLANSGKQFIIRIPLIPDINDDHDTISKIGNMVNELNKKITSISLLPYHTIGFNKYHKFGKENKMKINNTLSSGKIGEVKQYFEKLGFRVNIGD